VGTPGRNGLPPLKRGNNVESWQQPDRFLPILFTNTMPQEERRYRFLNQFATQRTTQNGHIELDGMTHPIDKHVGTRIRQGRWMRGATQQNLGDAVGCKFQKYETGANRVSASRLCDIANALDVPIIYFFEGKEQANPLLSIFPDRGSAELLRIWMSMPERQKQALLGLAKSMTDMEGQT